MQTKIIYILSGTLVGIFVILSVAYFLNKPFSVKEKLVEKKASPSLSVTTTFTATATSPTPLTYAYTGWQTITNTQDKYTLMLPNDWKKRNQNTSASTSIDFQSFSNNKEPGDPKKIDFSLVVLSEDIGQKIFNTEEGKKIPILTESYDGVINNGKYIINSYDVRRITYLLPVPSQLDQGYVFKTPSNKYISILYSRYDTKSDPTIEPLVVKIINSFHTF